MSLCLALVFFKSGYKNWPIVCIAVHSTPCRVLPLTLIVQTERMDRQEKLLLNTISALNRVTAVQQQQATASAAGGGGSGSDVSAAQREAVVQQMRAEMRAEVEVRVCYVVLSQTPFARSCFIHVMDLSIYPNVDFYIFTRSPSK